MPGIFDGMTEILRAGAQKMLAQMIRQEVDDWLAEHEHLRDEHGRRQVVRNGFLPKRAINPRHTAEHCYFASTASGLSRAIARRPKRLTMK
jgi:hypothetical protein